MVVKVLGWGEVAAVWAEVGRVIGVLRWGRIAVAWAEVGRGVRTVMSPPKRTPPRVSLRKVGRVIMVAS
ncbi:hypothetical protein [Nonomuraea jabiensis]|uniref:hypothetical protein n=1 Tax=Nonomuraea jabiensis TaxID=882448 RepID=UPI003D706C68